MAKHGAEENLPITPLAQWMRDTTGYQGEGSDFDDFIIRQTPRNTITVVLPPQHPVQPRVPHALDPPEDFAVPFEFDKSKLYQAARDAVESYITEGHTQEEILEHERRIWALHDTLIGESRGKGSH
jgi:hypothetical protein